ncbi:hypothetical protein NIES2135_53490 [Leptolyngbya boryana NIES-2135]|uniref:Uncharacterized protein n=1 Tax=Leptolyngbya boryana NIES-2135 TaxID=1973484 RepID=A0A1Z4JP37_LEPBY|nr:MULTISPECIES: hypothetical protein [Leptolyngbya]BAY58476.1 hypothetical protein NIES2135_53490 [Leptolyngbya boryana NIES-2135]MBD2370950.1 hypothetical protein [Leptolyngbya sp. FACHB-161]MBD2377464.1 hypothetical protein [Leptolyngbya sp. FACHB-238]MBD2401872.1 hypothetical protein [Leptolyngbya sp. FACHB-239]MBD2408390.1 hypothetical protein [Leptolyngbya sp. FACHB-402]
MSNYCYLPQYGLDPRVMSYLRSRGWSVRKRRKVPTWILVDRLSGWSSFIYWDRNYGWGSSDNVPFLEIRAALQNPNRTENREV